MLVQINTNSVTTANVIIFGANVSSSVHVDNKNKDILNLGEGPTQRLDDTPLIAESKYAIIFAQAGKRFVLNLHYNGSNNATKIYQFKAEDSEIKDYTLCLGNISKDFKINNMNKTGLKGVVNYFSVDFNPVDTNDISDIHR